MWPFRKKSAPTVLSTYDPGEEGVYRHKAGRGKWVDADPMELVRRLAKVGDALRADLQMARSTVVATVGSEKMKAAQEAAYDAAMEKMRGIFNVKPLSEGGLSDIQLMKLFDHFTQWIEVVKKNSRPTATPAGETSSPTPPPTLPVVAAGLPTSTTSVSGSTGAGSCTASPTPTTLPGSCQPGSPTLASASGNL